jgi:hypothetical protein
MGAMDALLQLYGASRKYKVGILGSVPSSQVLPESQIWRQRGEQTLLWQYLPLFVPQESFSRLGR